MIWARSTLFNIYFYLITLFWMIVLVPFIFLPGWKPSLWVAKEWGNWTRWGLRVICKTGVEVRGLENIPPGGMIIAAKHQSAWETMSLIHFFPRSAYIFKRELMYVPFFGLYVKKSGGIPVDRRGKQGVMAQMVEGARRIFTEGRQLVIYPEGTRRAVGAPPDYKRGVTALYTALDATVVPVALNSGLFWPRRTFLRYPGTVLVEVMPPIQPGLSPRQFEAKLIEAIEGATARLVAESRAKGEGFPEDRTAGDER